jgi:hypothetical protein
MSDPATHNDEQAGTMVSSTSQRGVTPKLHTPRATRFGHREPTPALTTDVPWSDDCCTLYLKLEIRSPEPGTL